MKNKKRQIKEPHNKFIQPTPNSRFSFSFQRLWRGRLMTVVKPKNNIDKRQTMS